MAVPSIHSMVISRHSAFCLSLKKITVNWAAEYVYYSLQELIDTGVSIYYLLWYVQCTGCDYCRQNFCYNFELYNGLVTAIICKLKNELNCTTLLFSTFNFTNVFLSVKTHLTSNNKSHKCPIQRHL